MTSWITWASESLAFAWLLLVLWTTWQAKKGYWKRAAWGGGVALLASVVGGGPLPSALVASLERPYAQTTIADLPQCDAVVVLGGMVSPSKHDAFGMDLNEAVDRIIVGVEVVRQGKAGVLVMGGGGARPGNPAPDDCDLVKSWLDAWKPIPGPIYGLGACRNTHVEIERALALTRQKGWKRVVVVTSAFHLKRAEGLCRKAGLDAVFLGSDFRGLFRTERTGWSFNVVPRAEAFSLMDVYLHEIIGWWIYRLRGWV